jgi:urease accessory protein
LSILVSTADKSGLPPQPVAFDALRLSQTVVNCGLQPSDQPKDEKMTRLARLAPLTLALATLPTAAFAHTGVGDTSGFAHGFMHPIGGLDHVLAMVAVGLLAARLGGKALWLVPLSFVTMMIVGGIAGVSGMALPFVEQGIAGSILVLGFVIALGRQIPTPVAMALAGFFAIFHGHAHGTEMPVDAAGLAYGAGFALATALLHGVGLAIGIGADRLVGAWSASASRIAGGMVAAAGAGIMAGVI